MRIALYDPSSDGGICHYTHQLAESLSQLGQDVTLVTNEGYELSHIQKSFRVHFLFKTSWLKEFLASILSVRKKETLDTDKPALDETSIDPETASSKRRLTLDVFRAARLKITFLKGALFFLTMRPHVIHVQHVVDRRQDCGFFRLLKVLGFKIVYTAHDLLPHDNSTDADREDLNRIYRLADRLVVHSESDKREMIGRFGTETSKISVVPHGSNRFFSFAGDLSQAAARKSIGLPGDAKIVLFFGYIRPYKGLEYLIEAFKRVAQNVAGATLLIAGRIHDGDREVQKHYMKLMRECRARPNITVIDEYITLDQVQHVLFASDLVVLPYVRTHTSGVLLTAYAAGRPVVVTDTGALGEVVEDGRSGHVVPSRDVSALAEAIISILGNPDRLTEMGRYARYLADTTYSWENVARQTLLLYESLLAEPLPRTVPDSSEIR